MASDRAPRRPQQNGKVERSHRIDHEEFWGRHGFVDFETAATAELVAQNMGEAREAVETAKTPPADEIRAVTKFVVPKWQVFSRLSFIIILSIFLLPHVFDTSSSLVTWIVIIAIFGWPFVLFWRLAKIPVGVSLRMEGRYLYLKTGGTFLMIIPKIVEWRNPNSFRVRSGRKRMLLDFPNPTEATRAYRLITDNFPEVQVHYAETRPG